MQLLFVININDSIEYHRSTPHGVGSRKTRKPLFCNRKKSTLGEQRPTSLPKERMRRV